MSQIFRGGIPTKADVDRLMEAYPVAKLVEGAQISYAEIEAVIKEKYGTNRFRGVVTRWRRMLFRDHNIYLYAPGAGSRKLIVADPTTRISDASKKNKTGQKYFLRASAIASTTDTKALDDEQRRLADRMARYPRMLELVANTQPQQL